MTQTTPGSARAFNTSSRRRYGFENLGVARAAAKISAKCQADVIFRRVRVAVEQRLRGDKYPRRAIAALYASAILQGFLQRVRCCIGTEASDSGDLLALADPGQREATVNGGEPSTRIAQALQSPFSQPHLTSTWPIRRSASGNVRCGGMLMCSARPLTRSVIVFSLAIACLLTEAVQTAGSAGGDAAAKCARPQGPVLVRTGVVDGVIAAVHVEKGRVPIHTDGLAVQG